MSKVALSRGWSLEGYHQAAISGSPTATAPSAVRVHGVKVVGPTGVTVEGTPA
jgi:hypothetical protein